MIKFEKVSFETFKNSIKVQDLKWADLNDEDLKKIYDDIQLPTRSTKHSAGYDFKIPYNINLPSDEEMTIPLGIKAYMNNDNVLMLYPRSSLGFKNGFSFSNVIPVIDSDYVDNETNEGNILIKFKVDKELNLSKGSKICQGIFVRFDICDDDSTDTVRNGGLGSTGK